MAFVQFSLRHDFTAAPEQVWRELVDWEGHAAWIPATRVEVDEGDTGPVGTTFTAWSGYRPFVLEDRMRVEALEWVDDARRGHCRVVKLGPVLEGEARFTVEPAGAGTTMEWVEEVTVPYLPQLLAPIAARVGIVGFRMGMRRLAKLLDASTHSAARPQGSQTG